MRRWLPALLMALILAACGTAATNAPGAPQPTAGTMMEEKPTSGTMMEEKPTSGTMMEETPTAGTMMEETPTAGTMMEEKPTAAWQQLPLVNARTGETFTLADFQGKTVFVEAMATWCPNCRTQLTNVQEARKQLGSDQYEFVALSVETTLQKEELAHYADEAGFGWRFAVVTPEVLQALTEAFGRSITNPPATPHFIIRPDGSTTTLITGIDSSTQLIEQLKSQQGV